MLELDQEEAALLVQSLTAEPVSHASNRSLDIPLLWARSRPRQHLEALIKDEFGDGIISAIDFNMTIAREEDLKDDRVKI